MSTTNLAENAAPPAALPAPPLVPSSKMEEDTESARGGLRPPHHGCCHDFLRHNKLTVATIAAVVAGITLGVLLRPLGPFSKRNIMYINFPGEVFLRMLRGLILPLITSSMVAAVGSLDARLSGKIGLRAVVYYFTTTFMAIVLGIVLVLAIQPGSGDSKLPTSGTSKARLVTTADTLMDLIRRETGQLNAFPPNVIEACVTQFSTLVIQPTGNASNTSMYDWDFQTVSDPGTNILGLIVFCIALGATVGRMGDSGKPLLDMFTSLSDAMMIITKLVVWFSPVGVMFLVMAKMLAMEDFSVVAGQVGMYSLTVLLGLFLHGFIVLPLIYSIVMRKAPFLFLMDMMQAIATAFGTASRQVMLRLLLAIGDPTMKFLAGKLRTKPAGKTAERIICHFLRPPQTGSRTKTVQSGRERN
ncbi:unnamed protein product [Ixodes persulcatus]